MLVFFFLVVSNHIFPQHTLPHPHVVNNAHPATWTPYTQFQRDRSINKFLAGIMMSYECGNQQATPIDTHVISNAHPVAWKSHSKFQSRWSFD